MKYNLIALACAVLLAAGLSLTVTAGPTEPDTDGDGVCDESDDCTVRSNTSQADSDTDGYGNVCDADYNNDGKVQTIDFITFQVAFTTAYDEQADHNCDGKVQTIDFITFQTLFGAVIPGPTGLACATGNIKGNCSTPTCP